MQKPNRSIHCVASILDEVLGLVEVVKSQVDLHEIPRKPLQVLFVQGKGVQCRLNPLRKSLKICEGMDVVDALHGQHATRLEDNAEDAEDRKIVVELLDKLCPKGKANETDTVLSM